MAARFCSQCGHEMASTAQFCPNCGKQLGAGAEVTKVEAAAGATRRLLLPLVIAALIVLAVTVAVLATRPRPAVTASAPVPVAPAPSILSAPTAPVPAPAITNAPSQPVAPAPALTNAASKPAPQLPPDVAQYLKFLEGIEERRIALNNDTSGASAMMQEATQMQSDQSDPDEHNNTVEKNTGAISQGYTDYVNKWNALARDFRSVSPPPACSLLANSYLALLTDAIATISKVQVALLNHDIGAAMGAQGAQKKVNADALASDTELGNLCGRYGVAKPFTIEVEGASSPLTGL